MELSMSGSSLRTFGRCVTFLARVASELVLQAHPAKLAVGVRFDLPSARLLRPVSPRRRGFGTVFHAAAVQRPPQVPARRPPHAARRARPTRRIPPRTRRTQAPDHPPLPQWCEEDVLDRVQRRARGAVAVARPGTVPEPPSHSAAGAGAAVVQLPVLAAGAHNHRYRSCFRVT
ncbi:cell cycle checkpoint control protein family [Zea mays]|uniref:Cell cycle checkpoint control protein family n=1 Tax=Zea mays TaxID=4577 RepID=A0A1D6K2T9_MAIZE|nr:cell cycle checkpoint control protein family [Zea mays]